MKAGDIILRVVQVGVGLIILMTLYYVIFTLCFSTDAQRRLEAENAFYKNELPQLEGDVDLLEKELEYLKAEDGTIYAGLFKTRVPSADGFLKSRALSGEDVMASARRTEENFREIFALLEDPSATRPPLRAPIENLDYMNVGASTGEKMNPFFKMQIAHNGVDLLAPPQTQVLACRDGRVSYVKNSEGGKGLEVEIVHGGGYVSRYACLEKAFVKKGARVREGGCIGLVGNSGRSLTTHLHYELEKDGVSVDPVYWFLDSADPLKYYKMLVMSAVSGQSLD